MAVIPTKAAAAAAAARIAAIGAAAVAVAVACPAPSGDTFTCLAAMALDSLQRVEGRLRAPSVLARRVVGSANRPVAAATEASRRDRPSSFSM